MPRGQLLFQIDARTLVFDSWFGPRLPGEEPTDQRVPAGVGALSVTELRDQFGTGPLQAEAFFREALGDPQYRFSLGVGRGVTRVHEVRIPFHLGYGISERFSLRVMVPIVRRRIESTLGIDPTGANVGLNPVLADAASVNDFMAAFGTGLDATRAEVEQTCTTMGAGSQECQEGQAFVADAESLFGALGGAYAESPVFPFPQSDAGGVLLARVSQVQAGMTERGVTGFSGPPPLASGYMDADRFAGLFVASAFGRGRNALTGEAAELWQLGDVEVSAAFRLLDLASGAEAGEAPGFRYRQSAGASLRLATSPADTLAHLIGPQSQRGRSDLELQHFNDFSMGRRLGLRVDLRYGIPLSQELERFHTPRTALFDPSASRRRYLWSPAGYQSIDVVPRVLLTPELAFGFRYNFLMRGEEEYVFAGESGAPPAPLGPAEGATDSRLHRLGGSLVYSTLEAAREGRTALPFEVRARYDAVIAGRGGVPRTSGFEAGVKFFLP